MAQPPYDPYGQQPYGQQPAPVQHHYYGAAPMMAPPTNSMATAALICGIAGFFCGIAAPLAIIFGHMAQSQIKRTGEGGSGMAVAGLILGYIVTVFTVIILVIYFGLLAALIGGSSTSGTY
ncbi:DUF4190 domain-containing protein [Spirillospora sp. NPDC127200]